MRRWPRTPDARHLDYRSPPAPARWAGSLHSRSSPATSAPADDVGGGARSGSPHAWGSTRDGPGSATSPKRPCWGLRRRTLVASQANQPPKIGVLSTAVISSSATSGENITGCPTTTARRRPSRSWRLPSTWLPRSCLIVVSVIWGRRSAASRVPRPGRRPHRARACRPRAPPGGTAPRTRGSAARTPAAPSGSAAAR